MQKNYPDPGPAPENATPRERERHRKDEEKFLTEGMRPGAASLPAEVDPTDRRLAQLRRDHRLFMADRNPMTSALWLALLRPAKDVIAEAEQTRRFRQAQAGELPDGVMYAAPERPAIVEIAQQQVAAAIGGDLSAIERIAERIEGKTGMAPGHVDPEERGREKQSEVIVSKLVEKLTASRVKPDVVDVEAVDITPENNSSKD